MVYPESLFHPACMTDPSRVAFTTEPAGAVMSRNGWSAGLYACDITPFSGQKKCLPSIGRFIFPVSEDVFGRKAFCPLYFGWIK